MPNPEPRSHEEDYIPYEYPVVEQLFLEKPQSARSANFFEVILSRKSTKQFTQLSLIQLSELLWYSAHVKGIFRQHNGYVLSHRPSPSAGGRHPIDLIVSSPILGIDELYVYDAFEHTINKLHLKKDEVLQLHEHSQTLIAAPEATTIWFLAHPSRESAKYENSGSLIWRDAGAMIYNIQIVAAAWKINSCAIGTL